MCIRDRFGSGVYYRIVIAVCAKGQYVFGIVSLSLVADRIIQNLFLSDSGRFLIGKCHDPRPVSFLQGIFPEQSACRHQAESKIYQLAVDKRLRRTGRVADYYHVFGIGSERLIRKHRRYSNQKKRPFKKALIL